MDCSLKDELPKGNVFSRVANRAKYGGGLEAFADMYRQGGVAGLLRYADVGRKTCDCFLAVLAHKGLIDFDPKMAINRRWFDYCKAALEGKEHD